MEEIWKDIVGYEGYYQVSNLGNVKSLNYKNVKGQEHNLTFKTNNDGRLWVILYKNGISKPMLVHRIVGMAFLKNPENLPQINHKDENPKNNNVENLEWCTGQYNIKYSADRHPERYANCGAKKGSKHNGKNKKFKVMQLSLDGELIREWENTREIYLQTGMSSSSITDCCKGKRRKAYGFKWQYAI